MSNTVSTEATLFSTTHPDVVKRTSVSSIIISAILCVIGAGAFATSLKMGDSSSTMSMVLMPVEPFCFCGRIPLFLARQGMGICTYRQRS